jgi:hypothetical protein
LRTRVLQQQPKEDNLQQEQTARNADQATNEVRVGDVEPGQFVTIRAQMVEQYAPLDRIAPRVTLVGKSFSKGNAVMIVSVDPDTRCTVEVVAAAS